MSNSLKLKSALFGLGAIALAALSQIGGVNAAADAEPVLSGGASVATYGNGSPIYTRVAAAQTARFAAEGNEGGSIVSGAANVATLGNGGLVTGAAFEATPVSSGRGTVDVFGRR